jgi:hypothetical protein
LQTGGDPGQAELFSSLYLFAELRYCISRLIAVALGGWTRRTPHQVAWLNSLATIPSHRNIYFCAYFQQLPADEPIRISKIARIYLLPIALAKGICKNPVFK